MKITITTNLAEVRDQLGAQAKQVSYAAAVALTKTAAKVRQAIPAELDRVLDRPTPFTKSGTYIKRAEKHDLVAEVNFRPIQSKYLRLQADGGTRPSGDAGIKLPGNIVLNEFGNIPKGLTNQLKAAAQNGKLSAAIVRRLGVAHNRRKGAAPIQLFYGVPQGKGRDNAPVGIWRRIPSNGGKGKLLPVIVFSSKGARYRKRLDLERMAKPVVVANFSREFDAALAAALATAR